MTSARHYDAFAYAGAESAAVDKGKAWVTESGVSFQGAASSFTLPLPGLTITQAGATGDTFQFIHPQHQGYYIGTLDSAILREPALQNLPGRDKRMGKSGRRRATCCFSGCLAAILAIALLVLGFFMLKDQFAKALTSYFPPELEEKIGKELTKQYVSANVITDEELVKHLDAIARPVLDAIPNEEGFTSFTLYLVNDEVPNAFALPGGNIVVNSGLIQFATTPEQVAGVIAHEAGHATLRHGLQSLVSRYTTALAISLVLGDQSGLGGILVSGGEYLANQKYSRDAEREADEKAWQYLLAANVDPRGLKDFFANLEAKHGDTPGSMALLSTHPALEERQTILDGKIKALPADKQWKKLELDFPAFQQKLKKTNP